MNNLSIGGGITVTGLTFPDPFDNARAGFIRDFVMAKYYQEGADNNLNKLLEHAAKTYDFSIGKVSV